MSQTGSGSTSMPQIGAPAMVADCSPGGDELGGHLARKNRGGTA